MTKSTSAVRPWARGLFELAKSTKQQSVWQTRLLVLSETVTQKNFFHLVSSRLLDSDQVVAHFEKLGNDLVDPASLFLVRMLVAKKRLSSLPAILKEFNTLLDMDEGTKTVDLTTATKLSDKELKDLTPHIEKIFNSKAKVLNHVDSSILGGLILKSGDLVLDNSAKRRWERLHTFMKA